MVMDKIQGEWKKIEVGGKNIFQMFCILSQNQLSSENSSCLLYSLQ